MITRNAVKRIANIRERSRRCGCELSFWPETLVVRELVAIGRQGQSEQCFLLDIVGLSRAGCRSWAGGALHRKNMPVACEVPQSREHIVQRTHVCWLFLHPY